MSSQPVRWSHLRSTLGQKRRKAKLVVKGKDGAWLREAALAALHLSPLERTKAQVHTIAKYFHKVTPGMRHHTRQLVRLRDEYSPSYYDCVVSAPTGTLGYV